MGSTVKLSTNSKTTKNIRSQKSPP